MGLGRFQYWHSSLPWREFRPADASEYGIKGFNGYGRYDRRAVRELAGKAWAWPDAGARPIFQKRLAQVVPEQIAIIWAAQRADFPRRLERGTYAHLAWLYWQLFQLWRVRANG